MSYPLGPYRAPESSPWPMRLLLLAAISLLLLLPLGVYWLAGGDVKSLLNRLDLAQLSTEPEDPEEPGEPDVKRVELQGTAALLLTELEPVVEELVKAEKRPYDAPKVVAFEQGVESSCHGLEPVRGPFYCQLDETLYVDNDYLDQVLQSSIEAGDLSRGYLVCRMMAQHLQTRLGSVERFRDELVSEESGQGFEAQMKFERQCEFFTGFLASRSPTMKRLWLDTDAANIFPTLRQLNEALRVEALAGGPAVADSGGLLADDERLKWLEEGRAIRNFADLKSLDPYANLPAPPR
jgi:predicted metalloprotease